MCRILALIVAIVWGATCAIAAERAEQWPEFRGPDGQGNSTATDLPIEWNETQNVAWKQPIPGEGWSSPVVWENRIWLTTATEEGQSLRTLCCDRATGRILYDVEVFHLTADEVPNKNQKNSFASPTPVVDGKHVWVHFGTLGTACLNAETGSLIWQNRDLKIDHKEGPGSSPIVHRDLLIIPCDGIDDQYICALNKLTGKVVWRTDRSGKLKESNDQHKAYSTPLVIEVNGQEQLISTAADWVYAYDPRDGKELWRIGYDGYSNVPRPLFGHGLLYISTGYNTPQLWALRPNGQGDVTDSHVAWTYRGQIPANASPVLIGDRIYCVSDRGVVSCINALDGSEVWKKRAGSGYSASPVVADGKIYLWSEEGEVHVLAPGDEYQVLATNKMEGRLMASPAILGREIYLRTDTHLYRIEKPQIATAGK
jgi:outer membrane protein assembly factor BamB